MMFTNYDSETCSSEDESDSLDEETFSLSSFEKAISDDKLNKVKACLRFAPSLRTIKLDGGCTPLILAARYNAGEVAHHLISVSDVNAVADNGYTALHYAALNENLDLIINLLGEDANIESVVPVKGATPLSLAVISDNTATVELLKNYDANVNCVLEAGMTPLMIAASLRSLDMVSTLVTCGAKLDLRNTSGFTALGLAISNARLAHALKLVEYGATVDERMLAAAKEKFTASDFSKFSAAVEAKRLERPKSIQFAATVPAANREEPRAEHNGSPDPNP